MHQLGTQLWSWLFLGGGTFTASGPHEASASSTMPPGESVIISSMSPPQLMQLHADQLPHFLGRDAQALLHARANPSVRDEGRRLSHLSCSRHAEDPS